jgi:hypothetical protein
MSFGYGPVGLFLQEQNIGSDFSDLGTLLLVGFLAAVVIGLAFTFVRIHLREKRPADAGFISIGNVKENDLDAR